MQNTEVLLVFPGKYHSPDPQFPLGILHVAYPLVNEGYDVRIFDMRVEDYRTLKIGNPLFVGISAMTGFQIQFALDFAKKSQNRNSLVSNCLGRSTSFLTTRANHVQSLCGRCSPRRRRSSSD